MKNQHSVTDPTNVRSELVIEAAAVSRGFAIGTAVCLFGRKRQFFRLDIPSSRIEAEIERFRTAIRSARGKLEALITSTDDLPESASGIFDVHLLIIDHSNLVTDVEALVREQRVNAEWALKEIADEHADRQSSVADINLREKAVDFQDVTDRIMTALGGNAETIPTLAEDAIVIGSIINPSTIIELSRHRPKAIVTEHGGWTSHAFIMAREMRIPAVTGVKGVQRQIADGDVVAVDGFTGRVFIRPTAETLRSVENTTNSLRNHVAPDDPPLSRSRTLDGREIALRVNAEQNDTTAELRRVGAEGIGLLRSEYLFTRPAGGLPSEDAQVEAYSKAARTAGTDGVRIRTFDLHVDQLTFNSENRETNPALGLRAIRLSLASEPEFRAQIRAILRAAKDGNVSMVLPMVSGIDEIERSKSLILEEKASLRSDGIEFGNVEVGAMIEVPSAVITIDQIVRHVDFLCIGTNDLVQYLLAVDRDNESVADLYQTLHPAVVSSLSTVIQAADHAGIPVVICGEIAGSPFYTPLLVGLGAREFSMNVNSIRTVRAVINGISFEETFELARSVSAMPTAKETEIFLRTFYLEKWPHLFANYFITRNLTRTPSIGK